jgi:uncharacterized repeat protein (TIGR03943 family)
MSILKLTTLRDPLLLLLWGGLVLWLAVAGRLAIYLHPTLQPFTAGAGGVFLILAAFGFQKLFITRCPLHGHQACCDDHAHDHGIPPGHAHQEAAHGGTALLGKTILLLIPLGIVLSGQGTAYSITTVQNRGVVNNINNLPSAKAAAGAVASGSFATTPSNARSDQPDSSSNPPSGGPMPLQVIDMLYAVQMPSYRSEFEGKQVELVGQYVPMTTGNPKGDRFQVIRMFITCCAADAKPVGVTVRYPKPLKVPEMGWVKITGLPTFPVEGGRRTALIEANKVEECPAPNEPFVY